MPYNEQWGAQSIADAANAAYCADGDGILAMLHPQHPYCGVVPIFDVNVPNAQETSALQDLAETYLRTLVPLLTPFVGQPVQILSTNGIFQSFANGFRMAWLPFGDDPNNSVLLVRTDPVNAATIVDVSIALFAVQVWDASINPLTTMRSGVGLRVDAVLQDLGDGRFGVRIIGAALSTGLPQAMLAAERPRAAQALDDFLGFNNLQFADLPGILAPVMAAAAGTTTNQIDLWGISTVAAPGETDGLLQVFADFVPDAGNGGTLHSLSASVELLPDPPPAPGSPLVVVVSSTATSLVAHATLSERLFTHPPPMTLPTTPPGEADCMAEPASRAGPGWPRNAQPNRSGQELEPFRHTIALGGLVAPAPVPLVDNLNRFAIRQSRFAVPAGNPALIQFYSGVPVNNARHNDFAAVSAYRQMRDLFDKIHGYGFAFQNLLPFLHFPVVVRYRSAMTRGPGRDGKVVNAEVDFVPPLAPLRSLEIRLGLADLQRSSSEREPLGIAADARWCWHEFGHVLLAGATRRLEFAFAHSPGDALAAIVNDPRSQFSGDKRPYGMRGATYPWVYINRRHDRAVEQGWSWSGTYHRRLRYRPGIGPDFHKGYMSEQILSTTLFRLYRALGGDTVTANPLAPVDLPAREDAANYTVYLIMRALRTLAGRASVHIPQVDLFANALMLADAATGRSVGGLLVQRVGGCAHKVVRWAFEQQGLYAGVAASAMHDAVGRPPAVDVFIDNRRQLSDPNRIPGVYTPVSLDWNPAGGTPPDWHAHSQAIVIDKTNPAAPFVTVNVGNRGFQAANGVVVAVWFILWDGTFPVPPWNRCAPVGPAPVNWAPLAPPAGGPAAIAPGVSRAFGPFTGLPVLPGKYLVLAEVNAIGDRANTFNLFPCGSVLYGVFDLPCASGNTRLVDLVAGDNNLGLAVYTTP